MNCPLVTIGVPVYRGRDDLPVTLECLRTQTHPNLDILISVDNGDQDIAQACQPFLRRDTRFRMQVQPKRLGWAGNTDWTMRHRRGEFYIYQQHDDQVSPSYVADLVEAARRMPDASICFAKMQFSGTQDDGPTRNRTDRSSYRARAGLSEEPGARSPAGIDPWIGAGFHVRSVIERCRPVRQLRHRKSFAGRTRAVGRISPSCPVRPISSACMAAICI